MRRLLLPLGVLLASPALALDLTARPTTRELEGINIPKLEFTDGAKKVTYTPPAGWDVSGQTRSLLLTVPDRPTSTSEARIVPMSSAEEKAMPLEKWVTRLLPAGAVSPEVVQTVAGPFTLGLRSAQEWLFRYKLGTTAMMRSISVVELTPEERFVLLVTAREADFKGTRDQMMTSMASFMWE